MGRQPRDVWRSSRAEGWRGPPACWVRLDWLTTLAAAAQAWVERTCADARAPGQGRRDPVDAGGERARRCSARSGAHSDRRQSGAQSGGRGRSGCSPAGRGRRRRGRGRRRRSRAGGSAVSDCPTLPQLGWRCRRGRPGRSCGSARPSCLRRVGHALLDRLRAACHSVSADLPTAVQSRPARPAARCDCSISACHRSASGSPGSPLDRGRELGRVEPVQHRLGDEPLQRVGHRL